MRVTRVSVSGLFGVFEHEIDFKLDERITIVHGPNGYGKTIILKMIAGLLTSSYTIFYSVPFQHFQMNFDDGTRIFIDKSREQLTLPKVSAPPRMRGRNRAQNNSKLTGKLIEPDGKEVIFRLVSSEAGISERQLNEINHALPAEMRYLGDGNWFSMEDNTHYGVREVLKIWGEYLKRTIPLTMESLTIDENFPLRRIWSSIHVHLIRTERLSAEPVPAGQQRLRGENPTPQNSVEKFSQDLVTRIAGMLGDYAGRASELDRTFPERLLLETEKYYPTTTADLKARFDIIERQRANLIALGFLEQEQSGLRGIPDQLYETQHHVLSVYVADMENKLNTFTEMATKVGLLTKIVNARFKHKTMRISRERGFIFESRLGELSPIDLSSGEQHELVLLYELLFKVDKTWLVMLDEPEISLHVAWQKQFLDDLKSIVKLSSVDVLIATHSPVIIGNHWDDLTVELRGPDEIPEE